MITRNRAAIVLLSTLFFGSTQAVLAADCGSEINAVRNALNDYVDGSCEGLPSLWDHMQGATRSQRICDGLNGKLDDADAKIGQRKYTDAAKKLGDFGTTLYNLAYRDKPIITEDEYSNVDMYLVLAQACVGNL